MHLFEMKPSIPSDTEVTCCRRDPPAGPTVDFKEAAALHQLKLELQRQQELLQRLTAELREREAFVEECEARLADKMQQQQEREIELEQREEDLQNALDRVGVNGLTFLTRAVQRPQSILA
jgi:hypothetical protein